MKKHVNVPIFIPHLGCPNQCVFCNQRTISGVEEFDITSIKHKIDEALSTIDASQEAEIAFFGGSFTGIDRELMISLLELSHSYVERGAVKSIRCSTRPDYIDEEVLDILEKYKVGTIELGLQTANDEVLARSKRGHTRNDEAKACDLIVSRGFTLVGQMMIGLPGSTLEDEMETARFIVNHGAHGARIYPTVVFRDTELCAMACAGEYSPLGTEDAVQRSARVLEFFRYHGVEVIRIGLCASENINDSEKYYGGPNHPALGEMVENAVYYNKITNCLENVDHSFAILRVFVAKGALSKAIGQKKNNIHRLIREYGFADVRIKEDDSLFGYEIKIEEERKR
jgi:histone acetyltransferase (RNA polymerase elongator complex component)